MFVVRAVLDTHFISVFSFFSGGGCRRDHSSLTLPDSRCLSCGVFSSNFSFIVSTRSLMKLTAISSWSIYISFSLSLVAPPLPNRASLSKWSLEEKKHARLWNVFSITPHNIRAPERGKTIGERWRVGKKRQKVWTSSAVLSNYNKKNLTLPVH